MTEAEVTTRGSSRLPITSRGQHQGAFQLVDWSFLGALSLIWGSSFLLISIALDSLAPGAVAWSRVALGAGALALLARSRTKIERSDWGRLAAIGIVGQTVPAIVFAVALQTVDSAVAGMLMSGIPIATTFIAVLMTRRLPGVTQAFGLLIGLGGMLLLAIPNVVGTDASPMGILLVLIGVFSYAFVNNVAVPVQQKYGSVPIVMWALALSSVLLLPYGLLGMAGSRFAWPSVVALVILGVVQTGIARSMHLNVVGRVGAPRGTVVAYFIPIVALILGVAVRDETVGPVELVGVAVAMIGAYLISRREPEAG